MFLPMTDTSADLDCGQTTASRATVLGCKAVMEASKKLKADLDSGHTLARLIGGEYRGEWVCNNTTKLGAKRARTQNASDLWLCHAGGDPQRRRQIRKVIAAHDVGKVMNPTLLEGQMEGSIHMGLGYALTEDFVCEDGRIASDSIKSIGVLRAHQMPQVQCVFIEEPDPDSAYGSRGVGEIGLVPPLPPLPARRKIRRHSADVASDEGFPRRAATILATQRKVSRESPAGKQHAHRRRPGRKRRHPARTKGKFAANSPRTTAVGAAAGRSDLAGASTAHHPRQRPASGQRHAPSRARRRSHIYPLTMDIVVADTEAGMGYMICQCLMNELARRGQPRLCTTIITTVRVDPDDPSMKHPAKPVGPS